jgi:diadenosine tetraphosphate (Ap4A) HIT family hydrolase
MSNQWPPDWVDRMRGKDCPMCRLLGKEDSGFGKRILRGKYADVLLQRADFTPGYAIAVWHRGHVAEPTELNDEEAAGFWLDVLRAAKAIERHYSPAKLNYQMLGNAVPHLHAHIVPRYLGDPAPGKPLPFPEEEPDPQDENEFQAQVEELRRLLS